MAAAFVPAKGVTLTSQQIADFPYATAYLAYGNNPRAQTVLAYAHESRQIYTTSEGRLLTFEHGRLLALEGFPIDFTQRGERLVRPSDMFNAAAPACWHGQRDVTGEVQGAGYAVSACLKRVGFEPAATASGTKPLLRVDEEMTWLLPGRKVINHFWLDPLTRDVVKSEQQIAPDLPVLHWEQLKPVLQPLGADVKPLPSPPSLTVFDRLEMKPMPADLPLGYVWLSVRAPAGQSSLGEPGRAVPARLEDVLAPYLWADVYWPSSRLFDVSPDPGLIRQQEQLVAQLDDLLQQRRLAGRHDLTGATRRLRDQVAGWRLAHRVAMAGTPAWVTMKPERNLRLQGKHYVLLLAARPQAMPELDLTALSRDMPRELAGLSTARMAQQLQQLFQNQY